MKKTSFIAISILALVLILSVSCGRRDSKRVTRTDTTTSGVDSFVSDDCFEKIMKEQTDVFVNTYVDAFITPIYANEQQAVELLIKDSVRLAILARELTKSEIETIQEANKELVVRTNRIATDGIALIINPVNMDFLISMKTITEIVTGGITQWKEINPESKLGKITVVFDNPKSSTVRYVTTELCGDKPLYSGLNALSNSQAVLEYVEKTPNAIGIIGINWISNPVDTTLFTYTNRVRPMWVSQSHPATYESSFPPHAGYISMGNYPLKREVYAVITDLRGTILSGFTNFVAGDIGQRIMVKAGLVPATRSTRIIHIRDGAKKEDKKEDKKHKKQQQNDE